MIGGLLAKVDGKFVGAVWVPMMKEILTPLKSHRHSQVSPSVQKANYATKMYQKAGFEIVRENEEEYIMICHL